MIAADISFDERLLEAESDVLEKPGHYIFFGIGTGDYLLQLMMRSDVDILLIEPDLATVIAVFCRYDVSMALRSGRLRLLLPYTRNGVLKELGLRECLVFLQTYVQEMQEQLIWLNSSSRRLNEDFFSALEQALLTWDRQFQSIAPYLQQSHDMVFDVTVISPCCAIFDNLAQCFRQLGFKVRLTRIPDEDNVWTQQQYHKVWLELITQPSQITIVRNRQLLETSDWRQRLALESLLPGKIISWWWDVPNVATHIDLDDPQTQLPALAFSRDILKHLPALSQYLPPAARQDFVLAPLSHGHVEHAWPVTFVGQSRYSQMQNHLTVMKTIFSAFAQDRVIRHLLVLQALKADVGLQYQMLMEHWCEFQQAISEIRQRGSHIAYFMDYLLQMLRSGLLRLAGIQLLVKHDVPIHVFGDEFWLASGIVPKAQFHGLVNPENLPALYQSSALNLNFNFMQSATTINPKVLDMAACGGAVLTDYQPELEQLYPDSLTRPFVFHSLDELPQQVEALLALDLHEYRQRLRHYTINHHSLLKRASVIAELTGLATTTISPSPLH